LPLTYQWNVAVQRELGAQSLTVTYLGTYGHNLLYNALFVLPAQEDGLRDNAVFNAGRSNYNALQVQLMRRMTHGLQAMISYSFSHSNDTASSEFNNTQETFTGPSGVQLPPLTPSDYDIHHNFTAALSYNIPT